MNTSIIFLITLLAIEAHAQTNAASSTTTNSPNPVMEEMYAWWNPTNALTRANEDIKSGDIKIYYEGTIAPFPAGVDKADWKLIKDLPSDYSGTGCCIDDFKLRDLQNQYGAVYNQRILAWIKESKE